MTIHLTFYIVWNPAGRNPSFRHDTYRAARTEAERLALQNPGQEFYVMAAAAKAKRVECEVTEFHLNDLPF